MRIAFHVVKHERKSTQTYVKVESKNVFLFIKLVRT